MADARRARAERWAALATHVAQMAPVGGTSHRSSSSPTLLYCRITGSDKTLKVRTLGCAQSSPPTDPRPSLLRSHGRARRTLNTRDTGFILVRATVVV